MLRSTRWEDVKPMFDQVATFLLVREEATTYKVQNVGQTVTASIKECGTVLYGWIDGEVTRVAALKECYLLVLQCEQDVLRMKKCIKSARWRSKGEPGDEFEIVPGEGMHAGLG